MSVWNQILINDAVSVTAVYLGMFHDYALAIITMILIFVGGMSISMGVNHLISNSNVTVMVEMIWTITPVMILVFLALPSLKILYLMEENDPFLTMKVTGRQWYWSYEMLDLDLEFDSYMSDATGGEYRLLDVDHRCVIPINKNIRSLVTASDVIHSWTVPSLGFKADGVPGRLNQVNYNILQPSVLYGQCSEICGANHSFMPVCIEGISLDNFLKWVNVNCVGGV